MVEVNSVGMGRDVNYSVEYTAIDLAHIEHLRKCAMVLKAT